MYEATTRSIRVTVVPKFLPEQSDPEESRFVWAYTVKIENRGQDEVQLRSRYWRITDGRGHTQEVHGPGVVGEEPHIPAGTSYSYTSGCPLPTPSGFMVGCYQMETPSGEMFNVDIPAFSLDCPHARQTVN